MSDIITMVPIGAVLFPEEHKEFFKGAAFARQSFIGVHSQGAKFALSYPENPRQDLTLQEKEEILDFRGGFKETLTKARDLAVKYGLYVLIVD